MFAVLLRHFQYNNSVNMSTFNSNYIEIAFAYSILVVSCSLRLSVAIVLNGRPSSHTWIKWNEYVKNATHCLWEELVSSSEGNYVAKCIGMSVYSLSPA